MIILDTDDVDEIMDRYYENYDEDDLAEAVREVWEEKEAEETTEDMGWIPQGVLTESWLDDVVFELEVGEVSSPIGFTENDEEVFYLFMVSEKAAARELDEESYQVLQDRALEFWLLEESDLHEIRYHGINNDAYDSETYYWIMTELAKMAD